MEQAFKLALINSRVYQFRLEQMYLTSLALTLQRFAFEPQFIAGLSPTTQTSGGGLAVNPGNSFLYRTKETGDQASILNLGTVAGVGKLLSGGGRLLASFASQVVFNFAGPTPRQPTVRSFLPLTFVQPFLRGGGRAVTLEPLTQAERNLLYEIRSFARFRQEFVVATLVGGGGLHHQPGNERPDRRLPQRAAEPPDGRERPQERRGLRAALHRLPGIDRGGVVGAVAIAGRPDRLQPPAGTPAIARRQNPVSQRPRTV